jgi:formate dehydrogenase beta subunit
MSMAITDNLRHCETPRLAHGKNGVAAAIAGGEIFVADQAVDVVGLASAYAQAVQEQSCGQCLPCRLGSAIIAELFARIAGGGGETADLDRIREVARTMADASHCDIGKSSPAALVALIDQYRDDFLRAMQGNRPADPCDYGSFRTAPCIEACPMHLDIPRYIEEIKNGRFTESLEIITGKLPLPGTVGRVCFRPCETACKNGRIDEPMQIKHLKRFVADQALAAGAKPAPVAAPPNKAKVAIVGAGPAGLTCAHFLARQGFAVTIYEILPAPGGMAAVGIPDYRLPADILRDEIEEIKRLGVEILYNKCLGIDFTIEQLEALGFKAVFLAMGCHCHKKLGIEGESSGYYGYVPGILFLRHINLGELDELPKGKKIVVVGGGNVALDCVRTSFRVGFTEAHLVYRRSRAEMPADDVEIHDAEEEGVQFHFLIAPKRIIGKEGKVTGLECTRMELGEPDASGRRRPMIVPGSEFVIEADVIVAAIGQEGEISCLCNLPGVEVDDRGIIKVDHNLMSSRRGIFAGGDCISGPDTLIGACAHGRLVGLKIARFLEEQIVEQLAEEHDDALVRQLKAVADVGHRTMPAGPGKVAIRHEPPMERKNDFREVDKGFTPAEAVAEAERCHRCYKVVTYAWRK